MVAARLQQVGPHWHQVGAWRVGCFFSGLLLGVVSANSSTRSSCMSMSQSATCLPVVFAGLCILVAENKLMKGEMHPQKR